MNELFVGLDLSFGGTGCVILDRNGQIVKKELISTKHDNTNIYDIETRMLFILDSIKFLKDLPVTVVYIEDISFGSSGDGAAQLAALNYFIRIFLLESKKLYFTVPPTTLKKYITGNGQAKKNLMLKEIYKRWKMDFNDDNEGDAYALARMALDNYEKGFLEVIKKKNKKIKT